MSTDTSLVNGQVVDSVSSVVTLATGQSSSQAFAMLDAVLLETLGMAMHNAVNRQQGAGMVSSAAVTAACAKMLSTPFPVPPPPPPGPPPSVQPLPGPAPTAPPEAVIAEAFATGESAIKTLKAQAESGTSEAALAKDDLQKLAQEAVPPAAPTEPVTPPDPAPKNDDPGGAPAGA